MPNRLDPAIEHEVEFDSPSFPARFACHLLTLVNVLGISVLAYFALVVRWQLFKQFADFGVEMPMISQMMFLVSDLGWIMICGALLVVSLGKEFLLQPLRAKLATDACVLLVLLLIAGWCICAVGIPLRDISVRLNC